MDRRTFIQHSAAATIGLSPAPSALNRPGKKISASDKIRFGLIGANGMGWTDANAFLKIKGATCEAIADIDQSVLERRAADAEKTQGFRPKLFNDYRKLLEMNDLDIIVIGTPDHWHCLQLCDSLAAGKHVYCEKPVGRSIEECRSMLAVARRYPEKMAQIGQWQRSGTHYASALELVRSGKLGKVRLVKTWSYISWKKPLPHKPDGPAPEGVDYDFWLGPAPKRPFNPNRFHAEFRWFWDYAGGIMTDWGVHQLDIALAALDLKTPKSALASGGKLGFPNADGQTPDTLQAVFEFEQCNILWEHALGIGGGPYARPEGIAFVGNDATLVVDRGNWSLLPEAQKGEDGIFRFKTEKMPDQYRPADADYLDLHVQNFVQCIRERRPENLNCNLETASQVAIVCCMGNIAQRLGRKLHWNAEKMEFENDAEANQLALANYQNGWSLPR